MAILYGTVALTQAVPDMAYEAHSFGPHIVGTRVVEMESSENTHRFLASGREDDDASLSRTLYEGTRVSYVDMKPQAQVSVKPTSHSLNVPPRISDATHLTCETEGCDWWCSSHNSHKMVTHMSKKHGGV